MNPRENEKVILSTLIKDPDSRVKAQALISKPEEVFYTLEGIQLYNSILECINKRIPFNEEYLISRYSLSRETVIGIVKEYDAVPLETFENTIHNSREVLLQKEVIDTISTEVKNVLENHNASISEKLSFLKEKYDFISKRMSKFGTGIKYRESLVADQQLEFKKREEGRGFYPTGDIRLDSNLTYGWAPGEITCIAGRPSNGKSLYGLHCAKLLSNRGGNALIFNLEMRNVSALDRLISMVGNFDYTRLVKYYKDFGSNEKEHLEKVMDEFSNNLNIAMYDEESISLEEMRQKICYHMDYLKTDYLVVFIDLMTKLSDFYSATSALDIEKICNKFQRMVKDLGIHAIPILQINRDSDRVRLESIEDIPKIYPNFSQIKNSGAFEEVSDTILLISKPSMYANRYEWGDFVEPYFRVEIAKNRSGNASTDTGALLYRTAPGCLCLMAPESDWNPLRPNISEEVLNSYA